jgi:hypothetical protein
MMGKKRDGRQQAENSLTKRGVERNEGYSMRRIGDEKTRTNFYFLHLESCLHPFSPFLKVSNL